MSILTAQEPRQAFTFLHAQICLAPELNASVEKQVVDTHNIFSSFLWIELWHYAPAAESPLLAQQSLVSVAGG